MFETPGYAFLIKKLSTGRFLIYDKEDEALINKLKWHAIKRGKTWYAAAYDWIHGRMVLCLFHRLVLGCPNHLVVHHRNGNGLDNRKDNLAKLTKQQHEIKHGRIGGNTSKKT